MNEWMNEWMLLGWVSRWISCPRSCCGKQQRSAMSTWPWRHSTVSSLTARTCPRYVPHFNTRRIFRCNWQTDRQTDRRSELRNSPCNEGEKNYNYEELLTNLKQHSVEKQSSPSSHGRSQRGCHHHHHLEIYSAPITFAAIGAVQNYTNM